MANRPDLECHLTASGVAIYRIPLEVFAGYFAYAHLICVDERRILVDTGSGFSHSPRDLITGLEAIGERFGLHVSLEALTHIIITHAHVDHFGGLHLAQKAAPGALTLTHPLTRPVLIRHDERVMVTRTAMHDFLKRSGTPDDHRERLMAMYMMSKQTFPSMRVDETFEDGDRVLDLLDVFHVPGHEAGLVMLRLDDVLLTADHILPLTSVAIAPESIMPYTGMGHYLDSLRRAETISGVRLALGGHERMMADYYAVVRQTLESSIDKIGRVLNECDEPRTIFEIATRLYGKMDGYGELLRIEQTGARIEYLSQRGLVEIANLDALESEFSPPLRYYAIR